MAHDSPTNDAAGPDVVFFDLEALVTGAGSAARLRPAARAWLADAGGPRIGVLANLPRELGRRGVEITLAGLGADGRVPSALIVDAASLATPLPDRRAFAAAAAIAEAPIGRCRYITTRPELAAAAEAAGMTAEVIGRRAGSRAPAGRSAAAFSAEPVPEGGSAVDAELAFEAALAATPIDEDTGPTFVLAGRIVTMNGSRRVLERGFLGIRRGRIVGLTPADRSLPRSLRKAPVIETNGTIYPGLIDLHNHYVYNIAPLWRVPRQYDNRTQWSGDRSKNQDVSLPVKLLAGWAPTAKAIARYVEAKAILGGTTTGQGMKTQVKGGSSLFRGAMRNVEETDDPRLPGSATLVPSIGRRQEDFDEFERALRKRLDQGGSYFYHLAEGTSELARRTYTDLRDHDLLLRTLTGVHSLGLNTDDLKAMAAAGSTVVWSPLSNLLLYGATHDPKALAASKVRFSIGCDWSPSGSKNLLQELKVARFVARAAGGLSSERLVRAVTADAAAIAGWEDRLGVLATGAFADVTVIAGQDGDPYDHLIDATEPAVRLVVVHGRARYGDADLMAALRPDPSLVLEPWQSGGIAKAFELSAPGSALNGLGVGAAISAVREALGDLHTFRDLVETGTNQLRAMGIEPEETFSLVLDNESADDEADLEAGLATPAELPASLEFDEPEPGGGTYWDRMLSEPNLPDGLAAALRAAYEP